VLFVMLTMGLGAPAEEVAILTTLSMCDQLNWEVYSLLEEVLPSLADHGVIAR
jgi:hypothetical protein